MHLPVLRTDCICPAIRRRGAIYYRDWLFRAGEDGSELHRPLYLYGSIARVWLPPELDDLLLGLLDGVVRGSALLYRQHFLWQDCTPDDSRRLCVRCGLYAGQLHRAGQLFNGDADDEPCRFYYTVRRDRRSIWNDCFYYQDIALCPANHGVGTDYDDCVLCNFLRLDCLDGLLL